MVETTVLEDVQTYVAPATQADVKQRKITIDAVPTKFSHRFQPLPEAVVQAQVEQLETAIKDAELSCQLKQAALLPLEAIQWQELHQAYRQYAAQVRRSIERLRQQTKRYDFDERYARIDMSFLAMQNWSQEHQCAVPLFAVFTPSNPICTIEVSGYSSNVFERNMESNFRFSPYELADFFETTGLKALCKNLALQKVAERAAPDVQKLHEYTPWDRERDLDKCNATLTATAKFAGLIPDEVRTIIRQSASQFDAVYLVAEVPEWTTSLDVRTLPAPKPIPEGDPLVIGRKENVFWLLTKFDTTASEQYAACTFTQSREKEAL
jgi:hypothetical protein